MKRLLTESRCVALLTFLLLAGMPFTAGAGTAPLATITFRPPPAPPPANVDAAPKDKPPDNSAAVNAPATEPETAPPEVADPSESDPDPSIDDGDSPPQD